MEPFNAIILIKLMHVTSDMLTEGGQHELFLTFLEVSHLMLIDSIRQRAILLRQISIIRK